VKGIQALNILIAATMMTYKPSCKRAWEMPSNPGDLQALKLKNLLPTLSYDNMSSQCLFTLSGRSSEHLKDSERFSAATQDSEAKPIDAVRKDPGHFVNGSLDTAFPNLVEPLPTTLLRTFPLAFHEKLQK
jgi:hypothetical protein